MGAPQLTVAAIAAAHVYGLLYQLVREAIARGKRPGLLLIVAHSLTGVLVGSLLLDLARF